MIRWKTQLQQSILQGLKNVKNKLHPCPLSYLLVVFTSNCDGITFILDSDEFSRNFPHKPFNDILSFFTMETLPFDEFSEAQKQQKFVFCHMLLSASGLRENLIDTSFAMKAISWKKASRNRRAVEASSEEAILHLSDDVSAQVRKHLMLRGLQMILLGSPGSSDEWNFPTVSRRNI